MSYLILSIVLSLGISYMLISPFYFKEEEGVLAEGFDSNQLIAEGLKHNLDSIEQEFTLGKLSNLEYQKLKKDLISSAAKSTSANS